MEMTIKIGMDNAAFEDCNGDELARILRKLAERLDGATIGEDGDGANLFDANGNNVGEWCII
jgi:hypothetical protein